MLVLQNVSKTFSPNTPNEIKALCSVDLHIAQGEYVVVVGANGSGKSTLLSLIAGSFLPDEGKIRLDNQDITQWSDFQRSRWIGRVFQNPLLGTAPDLSILENFRLAALRPQAKTLKVGTGKAFQQAIQEKIATLGMGLENKIHQKMGALSGGQRQVLTILMATVASCKIILMDEPTAALDPKSSALSMQIAQQLIDKHQLTALLITHHLPDAHHYGNRILQMKEGQIRRDIGAKEKKQLQLNDIFAWFSE
ncbi:MAG: ATP-binding cassette domain-containing protein [Cytophagales bacterium]|nr:MAG: ATP-binding cassette domain-containing protein [Cytophagales bacterium]